MLKTLLPLILLLSYSEADLQNKKGVLPLASGSIEATPAKDGEVYSGKTQPETSNQTAEDEERAIPPSRISGAYLRCVHIDESLPNAAEIGCNFQSENGTKVVVDPADFELSIDDVSAANPGISARKASSVTAPYIVQISVKAEEGQLQGVLDNLKIKVADLIVPGDVTYALPDIVAPVLAPVAADPAPSDDAPVANPIECGAAGDSCYSDVEAMARGTALTPSGKCLEYVAARLTFKVWKEVGSDRVLKADGSDNWAKRLNADGRGFSSEDFMSSTNIVGRTCPPNVFIDQTNKFSTGNCLYHSIHAQQSLNQSGTNGTTGIGAWSIPRWYTGNVATCSILGMRLPTAYEAMNSAGENDAAYPYSDGRPQFAGSQAILTTAYTWTATAYLIDPNQYMVWSPGNIARFDATASVICVLP